MPKETKINVFEKGMPPTIVPDEYPMKNYNLKQQLEQEILKEFEELGYEINSLDEEMIVLYSKKRNNNHIFIDKLTKSYSSHEDITLQEHQLLHRLFEIWNWI